MIISFLQVLIAATLAIDGHQLYERRSLQVQLQHLATPEGAQLCSQGVIVQQELDVAEFSDLLADVRAAAGPQLRRGQLIDAAALLGDRQVSYATVCALQAYGSETQGIKSDYELCREGDPGFPYCF
ncbi:MAG: hypothetical protein AAF608_05455 [Pseudomonadota bacterium]